MTAIGLDPAEKKLISSLESYIDTAYKLLFNNTNNGTSNYMKNNIEAAAKNFSVNVATPIAQAIHKFLINIKITAINVSTLISPPAPPTLPGGPCNGTIPFINIKESTTMGAPKGLNVAVNDLEKDLKKAIYEAHVLQGPGKPEKMTDPVNKYMATEFSNMADKFASSLAKDMANAIKEFTINMKITATVSGTVIAPSGPCTGVITEFEIS